MSLSYQNTESKAVDAIKKAIPSSLKQDMLKGSKGMFAELFENNEVFPKHYIATAIDGVGTKVVVAEAMHKFDTIGIDCVAMSANDLATLGAVSPFLFMDYLACQSKFQEKKFTGDLIKGVVKGLEQCNSSSILKNSVKKNLILPASPRWLWGLWLCRSVQILLLKLWHVIRSPAFVKPGAGL